MQRYHCPIPQCLSRRVACNKSVCEDNNITNAGDGVWCSDDVSITWSRTDGRSIAAAGRIERDDFNVRLQISQLERSDEGVYLCTGDNSAGTTPFSVQLLVHGSHISFTRPGQLGIFAMNVFFKLAATLRGSRPGVQSASLIMTSLMTS